MLTIAENQAGEILALKSKGLPSHLFARLLLLATLGPISVVLGVVIVGQVVEFFQTYQPQHLLVAFFLLLFFALAAGGLIFANYLLSGWTQVICHSREQRLTIRNGGMLPIAFEIPYSSIRSLKFDIGPEAKKDLLEIKVYLAYDGSKGDSVKRENTIRIKDCNLRTEAMDVIFQLGRALQWPYYRISRSDPRSLQIGMEKSADKKGAIAIPLGSGQTDFSQDIKPAHIAEPEMIISAFRPENLRIDLPVNPEITWNPRTRVQIRVPALTLKQILMASTGAALIGGFFGYILIPLLVGVESIPGRVLIAIGAALLSGSIEAGVRALSNPEREYIFDWSLRIATFRSGQRRREIPFAEIEEVLLRGMNRRVSGSKNQSGYTLHWCELIAVVPGPDETMIKTAEYRDDPDAPYKMSLPMCVELGKSLGIPWRWDEYK